MREIKFRAWDEQNKVMHNEVEFIRSGIDGNDWILFKSDKQKLEDGNVLNNPYFQQQIKLMQYTGIKDKNDVEIYEGDIVELTNTYKGMNTKSIVEIDFIDFTFAGKWAEEYSPSGYMYNPLGSYNFPIVTIEVIGNVQR